jgi:hypothetical protein
MTSMTVVQARWGRDVRRGVKTTGSENFNQRHVIRSLNELGDFNCCMALSLAGSASALFSAASSHSVASSVSASSIKKSYSSSSYFFTSQFM